MSHHHTIYITSSYNICLLYFCRDDSYYSEQYLANNTYYREQYLLYRYGVLEVNALVSSGVFIDRPDADGCTGVYESIYMSHHHTIYVTSSYYI